MFAGCWRSARFFSRAGFNSSAGEGKIPKGAPGRMRNNVEELPDASGAARRRHKLLLLRVAQNRCSQEWKDAPHLPASLRLPHPHHGPCIPPAPASPPRPPHPRHGSHPPSVLASSTRMISFSRRAGEACRTLYTVRSSVDQASLWKTMTTLVVGRGGHRLNFWSMHLRERKAGG